MVEPVERDQLLKSLKGYLEDLLESGLDEIPFGEEPVVPQPVKTEASGVPVSPPPSTSMPSMPSATPVVVVGNPRARLLFVLSGSGFTGESGELLSKIVVAMGFSVEDVSLVSFARGAAKASSLRGVLLDRIAAVAPEVVVALGEEAAQCLLESRDPIAALRGRFLDLAGRPFMATLHPGQLVADQSLKRDLWNEMKLVMQRLAAQG